ncbi:MAG: histone deacetylase family protein [Chromatiales bacterium]
MKRRELLRTAVQLPSAAWLARGAAEPSARAARTGFVFDERFLRPVFGPGHPEQPMRVRAILQALEANGLLAQLQPIAPLPDVETELRWVHTAAHIEAIGKRYGDIDGIARAGVGAVLAAVQAVCRGEVKNAFSCSRPPGHHARNTGREEGFCFYNNIAIGAVYAQREFGLERILIADWDYHHGDGTESFFYDDPSVLYFSTHDWHAYPGTGDPARRGKGAKLGLNINVPLACGATDADIIAAFESTLVPAADAFRPQLVLISAGFDSRADDLLGCFSVSDAGFVRLTEILVAVARRHCRGRLVSMLEGGYNVTGLASAVTAHLRALLST